MKYNILVRTVWIYNGLPSYNTAMTRTDYEVCEQLCDWLVLAGRRLGKVIMLNQSRPQSLRFPPPPVLRGAPVSQALGTRLMLSMLIITVCSALKPTKTINLIKAHTETIPLVYMVFVYITKIYL